MSAPLGKYTRDSRPSKPKSPLLWIPRDVQISELSREDLAIVNRMLRWQRKRAIEYMLSEERVAKCLRVRYKPFVELYYSPKVKRAHYGGMIICASRAMCPLCATKISERQRIELESAKTEGLTVFMVTWTLQHRKDERLKTIYQAMYEALHKFKSGRVWKRIENELRVVGSVMGTEITYGIENGWHYHKHELFYSLLPSREFSAERVRDLFSKRYKMILQKMGRYASAKYGVDVKMSKENDVTQTYITKVGLDDDRQTLASWSLVAELTKSFAKTAMLLDQHYTPFQLVDLFLAGDVFAGQKFMEYALTMKGKKWLVYSRGTRDLLGLGNEASDEDIANAQEQDSLLFALLKPEHWKIILKHEKRGQLLEVASKNDLSEFQVYCAALGIKDLFTPEEAQCVIKP